MSLLPLETASGLPPELPPYRYRGAAAMVVLHDRHMRSFFDTWCLAHAEEIALPGADDPDYASREHLLTHVLRASRGYMTWICEKLDLPDPGIDGPPVPDSVEDETPRYLDHLLDRWRHPLAEVDGERFGEAYPSRWGWIYTVEGMLEHAVMHPVRHEYQLGLLLDGAY